MQSIVCAALKSGKARGIVLATATALALCGCGGSSSSTATVSSVTGKFVDATVVGLGYKCGSSTALSGSTNANGEFTCKTGESVSFHVGGIKLGSIASPQAVVTPLDLVGNGASPSNTTVNNLVRFLMSISSTPAASGTLTIDASVVAAAASKTIDFATVPGADLDAAILAVKPAGATLATVQQATDHMSSSMLGLFAGSYAGSFSGSTSGTWILTIDSLGQVTGTATDSTGAPFAVTGSMATTMGTSSSYAFTGSGGGSPWTGTLNTNTQQFSGTWSGGTFTGKASTPPAAGPTTSSNPGGNILIVGDKPLTANDPRFGLAYAAVSVNGASTRVTFTDATPAVHTLRLNYKTSTGVLENVQYESPQITFSCFVGDPQLPCDSANISISTTGKSIQLGGAEFKSGTSVKVLEGFLQW
jgi:hypothetical protein